MKVLGIVGWSGSGKTTLITAVLPVATPGQLFRRSSRPIMASTWIVQARTASAIGGRRERMRSWSLQEPARLLHELDEPEPALAELMMKFDPVDLVLIGGTRPIHP